MRTAKSNTAGRRVVLIALVLGLALAATTAAQAGGAAPHVATSGVAHETATSGELKGSVSTHGFTGITYFFEYGPTTAYGLSTKPVPVPASTTGKSIPVGQTVTGLHPEWHYRIAAVYTSKKGEAVKIHGTDKRFTGGKASKLHFVIAKGREEQITVSYGGDALLTGELSGTGSGGRALTLQETPYPFSAAFASVDVPALTSATGAFSVSVPHLTRNTEFRLLTTDLRPLYSTTLLVHVTPRVTLRVRGSSRTGLYRLFGTVYPARNGAPVSIEQVLPPKSGSKRTGPRLHPVSSSVLKRGKAGASRFSMIVKLTGSFRYRAYVRLPQGALDSGSSGSLLLHGPKAPAKPGK